MSIQTLLAFDFGIKNIGVAIGQTLINTAHPLGSLKAHDGIPNWNKIEILLKEWQPDRVVVGFPLNMDGSEQPLTAYARKFANRLYERFGVQFDLHDERLSTVEARDNLFKRGGFRALKKASIDSLSAVIILESWFEKYHDV